jgi:hypothetical protein
MKKLLLLLFIASLALQLRAQVYNNEWIDYSKTYYKFKVGKNGLYHIPQSVLAAAGLSAAPAEQFQLWRNGVQVPLYTSVASGALPSGGYIEFWGQMNDGKPDRELYRLASSQLNDKWSLETDTAAYFLTLNANSAANLRLTPAANNTAGNTLLPEAYFMHTAGTWYRERINPGYAVNVGENLYSSTYDRGEGWSSNDIPKNGTLTANFSNLYAYPGGPAPKLTVGASGNAINPRRYKVTVNGDSVGGKALDFYLHSIDSFSFNRSSYASGSAAVTLTNLTSCTPSSCPGNDRMVVHKFELTYPRQFVFDGSSAFEFKLDASLSNIYLEITNFSYGSTAPVLYDLTNGQRYVADITSNPSQIRFVLPSAAEPRQMVLLSVDGAHINSVSGLQNRNFINYTATGSNTGDYLIISHPFLTNGPGGTNPVEDYRAYRASTAGGSYAARIYFSDEIIDQFGFGIKKNPAGIRNFIRYARNNFPVKPKHVFLIGHGVNYVQQQRIYESGSTSDKQTLEILNMIPTYGSPASDVMLASEPSSSAPLTPIGRLSVVSPQEVLVYLSKVKEQEQAQAFMSPQIADKAWMKNIVHIVGASDDALGGLLTGMMSAYERVIEDTLYGARVSTFTKTTSNSVEQLSNSDLTRLFKEGISIITYFGHSSATTLEFNLDNPENYDNQGKYPLFIGLGCNAGNFFNFNPGRLVTKETISEKYMLAPNKGTIGFLASTHFGIVHYLDIWNTRAYRRLSTSGYDKSIGELMVETIADVFQSTTQEDFYARSNAEETALHGDPAVKLNTHAKPDYVIEPQLVATSPSFVSVADASFRIKAKVMNIGKAPDASVVIEVKRQLPNGTITILKRDTVPGIRYADSIDLVVPINPNLEKGLNKITVTVDPENLIAELFESNNSVTKDVMIFEDEARPVYPYNYAIINQPNTKFTASTANPFSPSKQYRMELDTTELFNSPFLISQTVTSAGGPIDFTPALTLTNGRVYYWRVAPVPSSGPYAWNTASFIYQAGQDVGYNQSHLYQHLKSGTQKLTLDSSGKWSFGTIYQNLFIRQGTWYSSSGQEGSYVVAINSDANQIRLTCWFQSLVFNVFDGRTFKMMTNQELTAPGGANPYGIGLYNSTSPACYGQAPKQYNFEFRYMDSSSRRKAMDFMRDAVPNGSYVVVRSFTLDSVLIPHSSVPNLLPHQWAADTSVYGSGKSLYHSLKAAGFGAIDSIYRQRNFAFVYRKGDPSFTPKWVMTDTRTDNVTLSVDCPTTDSLGYIISPRFGPAKAWKELIWRGNALETTPGDNPILTLVGIQYNGQVDTLATDINLSQQNFDISSVNAAQYPYLQVVMRNQDAVNFTPYQLNYWRFTYEPAPEGAIAPNLAFSMKDTVEVGEPLQFKVAFKNVSPTAFTDSLKVKITITDRNNVTRVLPTFRVRKLPANDTVNVIHPVDTRQLVGANNMFVEINPDFDQPEQYHFNNSFFKNFYVKGDTLNPLLDVTFDNVRILNYDIVSAKPNILIKLKDESKWFLMDDPTKMKVQLRKLPSDNDPTGWLRNFSFGNDTLQFVPAQNASNTASAIFKPLLQDGKYELIVSGQDMSDNKAGKMEYRVIFEVIGKPMISNMLNYPNPFTTSTAFVFTITGSEVPQNIRIQILTVTGKVVREITKDELGPLHIGRNITEFKWDGTDQYGQKLANGVYLYRVITNLNGKSLDKFRQEGDNTDKYFNKGYGKMYLMR